MNSPLHTSYYQYLPTELILQILLDSSTSLLPLSSLSNNCLISKRFLPLVQHRLYSKITVKVIYEEISKVSCCTEWVRLNRASSKLLETLEKNQELAQMVKEIELSGTIIYSKGNNDKDDDDSGAVDVNSLSRFLKLSRNLTSIKFSGKAYESITPLKTLFLTLPQSKLLEVESISLIRAYTKDLHYLATENHFRNLRTLEIDHLSLHPRSSVPRNTGFKLERLRIGRISGGSEEGEDSGLRAFIDEQGETLRILELPVETRKISHQVNDGLGR